MVATLRSVNGASASPARTLRRPALTAPSGLVSAPVALSPGRPVLDRLVWARRRWWLELATIVAAYLAYEASRVLAVPRRAPALVHGRDVLRAEAWLHLDPEVALNHLLGVWGPLSSIAGYYYSTLHFLVTPLVLVVLWRRHPTSYPALRTALFMTTAVALVVFVAWPTAPPRFTSSALTDTLVRDHILGMSNPHGITGLINQYAAMPSLHVGWAVWCALALWTTSRSRWRHLVWLYPAATTFVVLSTANHYLLDAVAGALLVLMAVGLTTVPRRGGRVLQRPLAFIRLQGRAWSAGVGALQPATPILVADQHRGMTRCTRGHRSRTGPTAPPSSWPRPAKPSRTGSSRPAPTVWPTSFAPLASAASTITPSSWKIPPATSRPVPQVSAPGSTTPASIRT
jgi:hypothetical protein